jgi:hypothetical protein
MMEELFISPEESGSAALDERVEVGAAERARGQLRGINALPSVERGRALGGLRKDKLRALRRRNGGDAPRREGLFEAGGGTPRRVVSGDIRRPRRSTREGSSEQRAAFGEGRHVNKFFECMSDQMELCKRNNSEKEMSKVSFFAQRENRGIS